jgi:hypothetical protein
MRKITKKNNSVFNRPTLTLFKYYYNISQLYTSISLKSSFHFMTQKYQNFRCRVKRSGPKNPTLP